MNREEDHDRTVVVNAATDETVVTGDETVVVNLNPGDAATDQTAGAPQSGVVGGVPGVQGLDPRRPIAAVPGSAPWDIGPAVERGLSQGLPVSYGARSSRVGVSQPGLDEVQRRLGPAPAAAPVAVREGREALPSLERRERRGRVATLALFATVVIGSIAGLWGLASIAFGW